MCITLRYTTAINKSENVRGVDMLQTNDVVVENNPVQINFGNAKTHIGEELFLTSEKAYFILEPLHSLSTRLSTLVLPVVASETEIMATSFVFAVHFGVIADSSELLITALNYEDLGPSLDNRIKIKRSCDTKWTYPKEECIRLKLGDIVGFLLSTSKREKEIYLEYKFTRSL